MKLKEGVRLTGLSPQMAIAAMIAFEVYKECGASGFVITSANDRKHKIKSKHYRGDALDLRIWTLIETRRTEAVQKIAHRLGEDFDVILESDHLHIEYDPR